MIKKFESMGERIKNRRKELGLSQEELAEKLGYKSKTSISKIEQDITDLPLSKVAKFAEILKTTPGYILGTDETDAQIQMLPTRERLQLEELMQQNAMFFNDETVSDEDKEKFLSALQEAFYEVKFIKQQERKNKTKK